jgi:hypothetical protein
MLSDLISNSENQYEDEEVEDDIEGDLVDYKIVVDDEGEILESTVDEEQD